MIVDVKKMQKGGPLSIFRILTIEFRHISEIINPKSEIGGPLSI
jgi:hypothetical protein